MAALTITSITTSNGTTIVPPPAGVLCVVGGNNVGKSQFLREISAHIRDINGQFLAVLIKSVDFKIDSEVLNAEEWLPLNSLEPESTSGEIKYKAPGSQQSVSVFNFKTLMSQAPKPHIGPLIDWFIRSLDATERSSIGTMQIGSGSIRERSSAMHMLFRDGSLEASLSDLCEKAFGFPLTLDRVNGNVMLRVGKPSCASPSLQYPTLEYADAVRNLPSLHDQGDGVKNYLGMVLHMMTGFESVTIFDEPEAFLHPAQARALGRYVGQEAQRRERQLITATHDRDFILGLLGSNCPLTILRINRQGNSNTFTSIDTAVIADIWSKPALRYSNLLQGLFHRVVVLCEGDADCQWYAAVADLIGKEGGVATEEILFAPGGGKDQLPMSLAALVALDVSAFTITDFDSLYSPSFIDALLTAKGIDDEELVNKAGSLQKLLENDGRTRQAKESGIAGVPPGTATTMAHDLIVNLRNHRILERLSC